MIIMIDKELERRAFELALNAHLKQHRMDGKTPYIEHPRMVVNLLRSWGIKDSVTIAAAWLHDVIEDCSITKAAIVQVTNEKVFEIVVDLTRQNHAGYSRVEELMAYRHKLSQASQKAKWIKLADIIANLSDMSSITNPKPGQLERMMTKKIDDLEALVTAGLIYPD